MSRSVQDGCIASFVRYFLLPDRTLTRGVSLEIIIIIYSIV